MEKKKTIDLLFFGLLFFCLGMLFVNADSKYYNYRWTNEVADFYYYGEYITNDILKTKDGYVAVGAYEWSWPTVRFLNNDGLLIKEVEPNLDCYNTASGVFAVDGGYLVIGMDGGDVSVFAIDGSTYKIVHSNYYETEDFNWDYDVYFEEDDNYIYLISDYSRDSVVRISKSLKDFKFNELFEYAYTNKVSGWVNKYVGIWELEENIDKEYDDIYYYPTFVSDYADGYVYGYESAIYYVVDGKVEWSYVDENIDYIADGFQLGENFVIAYVEYIDGENDDYYYKSYLETFNIKGESLSKDDIASYIDEEAYFFIPSHLISIEGNGFVLTGDELFITEGIREPVGIRDLHKPERNSINYKKPFDVQAGTRFDEYPVSSQVLLFDSVYEIITKTDGNGTINVTKSSAYSGDAVEFTIIPKKGYVLGEVKVTDADGNVVTFTDYKFTMPNSNVTIEVIFNVENPETFAFLGMLFVVFVVTGAMVIVYKNKKPSRYNN